MEYQHFIFSLLAPHLWDPLGQVGHGVGSQPTSAGNLGHRRAYPGTAGPSPALRPPCGSPPGNERAGGPVGVQRPDLGMNEERKGYGVNQETAFSRQVGTGGARKLKARAERRGYLVWPRHVRADWLVGDRAGPAWRGGRHLGGQAFSESVFLDADVASPWI